MTKPIKDFMYLIYPSFQWAGEEAFFDFGTRKIELTALPNGNFRFFLYADGAGKYHPMTSIEIDPGPRFWARVVETVRSFTGAIYAFPDEAVALSAMSLPGAELLTQSVKKDERKLPEMPDYAAIPASRKTKTRRELLDDGPDFLDEAGSGDE